MMTIRELKQKILADSANWLIYLMDFVDDFRYYKDQHVFDDPFTLSDDKWDALLASTGEYLCDEQHIPTPEWFANVPACRDPWFVSGLENLKAIALVESPLRFRIRKIFVLRNFLSRT